MNHSEWRVMLILSGGKKFYQVFRLKDANKEDHESNRETRGGLYDRYHDADRLRNTLNEEESNR